MAAGPGKHRPRAGPRPRPCGERAAGREGRQGGEAAAAPREHVRRPGAAAGKGTPRGGRARRVLRLPQRWRAPPLRALLCRDCCAVVTATT